VKNAIHGQASLQNGIADWIWSLFVQLWIRYDNFYMVLLGTWHTQFLRGMLVSTIWNL